MILHILKEMRLQFGRCKSRAKMVAIQDSGGGIQKAGSLDFEIDFEFSCRTFSLWSKTGEFCGSPHLSGRFRARVHAACSLHTCMCLTDVGGRWPAAIVLRHRRRPEEASKQYPGEAPYTNRGLRHVGEAPLTNRGSVPRDDL